MKHKKITTRRSFIKKVFAGIFGGFAFTSSGYVCSKQQTSSEELAPPKLLGYRETEHIRHYYNKARF